MNYEWVNNLRQISTAESQIIDIRNIHLDVLGRLASIEKRDSIRITKQITASIPKEGCWILVNLTSGEDGNSVREDG